MVIIRAKDSNNYLVGTYWALEKRILFMVSRTASGFSDQNMVAKLTNDLGPIRRMTVKAQGTKFSITVSDGKKELTTTTTIPKYAAPGYVGLWHEVTDGQVFSNFKVTDLNGKELFSDSFDKGNGRAPGWNIAQGLWYDPNNKAELAS